MDDINTYYGKKVRVRVCGICIKNNQLLLAKHDGIGENGSLWIPPGGGLEFSESAEAALKREFIEECGIHIDVEKLLFTNEFFKDPLHAIELFFKVEMQSGEVKVGYDPEFDKNNQIIKEVRFMSFDEINALPDEEKHNILHGEILEEMLLNMHGHFKLWQ